MYAHISASLSTLCGACECVRMKSCPEEVLNACFRSTRGLWRIGRLSCSVEWTEEEGDHTLTPARCGDSPVDRRQEWDAEQRVKWNPNENPLNCVGYPTRCFPGDFTHRKRVKKTLQRCVVRGFTCSWRIRSPDKGTKEDKTRLSMIFFQRLERWSD